MLCAATLAACALATPVWAEDYPVNVSKDARTATSRWLRSFAVSSNGTTVKTMQVQNSSSSPATYIYVDKTDTSNDVNVEAGSKIKVSLDYNGWYTLAYLYLDQDNDGQFSYTVGDAKGDPNSDLRSFSGYNFGGKGSADNWRNSDGETIDPSKPAQSYNLPEFTAPSVAGRYRMRLKIDWNSIDPAGNVAGGSSATDNIYAGGQIVDFYLNVTGGSEPSQTAALPYTVNFENDADKAKGWTAADLNADGNTWQIRAGSYNGYVVDPYSATGSGAANKDELQSPAFSLQENKSYKIGLKLKAFERFAGSNGDGKLSLLYTVDGETYTLADKLAFPKDWADETKEDSQVFLPWQSGDYRFILCYTSSTQKMVFAVTDFSVKADSLVIAINTPEGYGTFYADDAYTLPEGLEGAIVSGYTSNADGTRQLTMDWKYKNSAVVPKGTALLVRRSDGGEGTGSFVAQLATDFGSKDSDTNLLHGANAVADGKTYVEATNGGTVKYYVFSYKAGTGYDGVKGEDLGFYWAAANGAAVTFDATKNAHRAFLAVEYPSEADAVKGFSFDLHPTGISTVVSDEAGQQPAAIYTLTGRRVNAASLQGLDKGIYIVGGKKVLVK